MPVARAGDQAGLDIFFEVVTGNYKEAEKNHNWAVAEKKPEATALAVVLAEALVDYTQGLDVQFDVVADAEQEALLPEVTLTEDEEDALSFPIDAARQSEGGQDDVQALLMVMFNDVLEAERLLAEDSADLDLQGNLAVAREQYRFTKQYAADSASQQVGLSEEELEALVKAASGEEEEIEEVPIDENIAAELAAELEKANQEAEAER